MIDFLLNGILDWLAKAILGAFDAIVGVINHILLVSPDVTGLPQVRALTAKTVGIVDAVFVLAFVAVGAVTMLSGGDERSRYTAKDLLSRCVVGFIAAHFSGLLCRQAITLANAIGAALTPDKLLGPDATNAMRSHLTTPNQAGQVLLVVVFAVVVFLVGATAFQAVGRMGILLLLTAIAPIALAMHALPQTDPIARLWWRAYAGCLAVPILQAFTLYTGEWMLTDTHTMFPELPMAGDPFVVLNLLIVVVVLWTTVKIPGLMRRYVTTAGRGPNVLGTVVRVVVVGQLSRSIPGLSRVARAVTR
jgi:hypothetical protein